MENANNLVRVVRFKFLPGNFLRESDFEHVENMQK